MSGKAVLAALLAVQRDLKAPKNQYNKFGDFYYRSCEDIMQAARPLCNENGLVLTLSDEIVNIGDRFYVKATSKVTDIATGESVENVAYARETESRPKMDASQLTGSCSSYARKYSMCGLFAIDDNKDPDTEEFQGKDQKPVNANSGQDSMRQAALKGLNERVKALGVSAGEVTNIIHRQYNKANSKEMTANEVADLVNNLKKYIDMGMGA